MPDFDDAADLLAAGPPIEDEGLTTDEQLAAAVVVDAQDDPPPPGLSWLFDMGSDRFVLHGGRPQETRGEQTLIQWIDKFLHTQKGGLPVHPAWFGLTDPSALFGRPVSELSVAELLDDLQDMTNHPNIADVVDVQLITDPLDDAAWLDLTVLSDPPSEDVGVFNVRMRVGQ
jgi:hypothetical protein